MSTAIAPIGSALQAQVISAASHYIELASTLFERPFPIIPVNFKLTGRAAGMYHVQYGRRFIRFNPFIFAKYYDDNLRQTVPHEVAHYIADMVYGLRNIKPHGREWKAIMQQFGIAKARATCNYDLQGVPTRQHRRFAYHCRCRNYEITTRRHNMILLGQRRYHCPTCKSDLRRAENS